MPSNEVLSLLIGNSWGPTGRPVSLTWSVEGTSVADIDQTFKAAVSAALVQWSNAAGVTFEFSQPSVLNPAQAPDILFKLDSLDAGVLGLTSATAYSTAGATLSNVTVTMNEQFFTPAEFSVPGSLGYTTMLHEIGHALGLSHPDDGSSATASTFSTADRTLDASVMISVADQYGTHTTTGGRPLGPQVIDIAAVQYLYGVNAGYNAGNTIYTYAYSTDTENKQARTIWDGGGVDVLDQSANTENLVLDIGEDDGSVTQIGVTRIWFAVGANVERAYGGSGNDTVNGNNIANVLTGGAGADSMTGGKGDDDINGNQGADTINGNAGNDLIRGGKDNDVVRGGKGNDHLIGDLGNDTIYGDLGNDTLQGNDGNDRFIYQTAGFGQDVIEDFNQSGLTDVIQISSSIVATATQAITQTTFANGNAVIALGSDSITLLGVTALDTGDFAIV